MKILNNYDLGEFFSPINEGLKKINKVNLLEDNTIIIEYTILEEYAKKNDLFYKNRILKLSQNGWSPIEDYANVMEVE